MGPLFPALVWLVAAAHFMFLVYLVFGGFLALRWRRTIWLHGAAVLWGVGSVVGHLDCPLTSIERWARQRAGMSPLPGGGFIDHYVTGVCYPTGFAGHAQWLAALVVATSWIAYAAAGRGHPRTGPSRRNADPGRDATRIS